MSRCRAWRVKRGNGLDVPTYIVSEFSREDAIRFVTAYLIPTIKSDDIGPLFAVRLPSYDDWAYSKRGGSLFVLPFGATMHRCPGHACVICHPEKPYRTSENPARFR